MPGLYDEWYELGYWVSYTKAELISCGNLEPSSDDASKPPNSIKLVKPMGEETRVLPMSTRERASKGARVLPIPIGEGTFEVAVTTSIEPVVITLHEFPSVVTGSPRPLLPKDVP